MSFLKKTAFLLWPLASLLALPLMLFPFAGERMSAGEIFLFAGQMLSLYSWGSFPAFILWFGGFFAAVARLWLFFPSAASFLGLLPPSFLLAFSPLALMLFEERPLPVMLPPSSEPGLIRLAFALFVLFLPWLMLLHKRLRSVPAGPPPVPAGAPGRRRGMSGAILLWPFLALVGASAFFALLLPGFHPSSPPNALSPAFLPHRLYLLQIYFPLAAFYAAGAFAICARLWFFCPCPSSFFGVLPGAFLLVLAPRLLIKTEEAEFLARARPDAQLSGLCLFLFLTLLLLPWLLALGRHLKIGSRFKSVSGS
jgi:hypothetical protein